MIKNAVKINGLFKLASRAFWACHTLHPHMAKIFGNSIVCMVSQENIMLLLPLTLHDVLYTSSSIHKIPEKIY